MNKFLVLVVSALVLVAFGCSSGPNTDSDPQKVVVKMFRAIEKGDRSALAHFLDFPTLLQQTGVDYALQSDTVRVFHNPEDILDDLLEGGFTYSRWANLQKIVNKSWQEQDSALVEVSFIDRQTDTQYYTKFGLRRVNDVWKVYSFNVRDR